MANQLSLSAVALTCALWAGWPLGSCFAADITFSPPAGGGFTVTNNAKTQTLLRVDEPTGTLTLPALPAASTTSTQPVCYSAQGVLTPCNASVLGATGPAGPTGPVGPQGVAGPVGPTGATGAAGPAGPAGATGPQGAAGPVGPTGTTGAQGVAGPAGSTGSQGVAGPVGPQGPVGPAGITGAQGPAGPQGPQGPAGSLASITIRSQTGTASGDVCQVSACCQTGEKVMGGGYQSDAMPTNNTPGSEHGGTFVASSYPDTGTSCGTGRQGWNISVLNSFRNTSPSCTAYAICGQ
ncbi:MAG: collagen-like protein [Curvibacter sp.]|nr:collagen-like protein [Curvibacter sp.]